MSAETIKTLILTGYRSYELGVFQEKDPKIKIIKKSIKDAVIQYLDDGLEWLLISGNLGVELWGAQVIKELQKDYPDLKLGIIFPYEEFGKNWQEKNQQVLQEVLLTAQYVNSTSHEPYKNPGQLKNHTHFLLEHSSGLIIVCDDEFPGKPSFFFKEAKEYADKNTYLIHQITMDDLQNTTFDSNLL